MPNELKASSATVYSFQFCSCRVDPAQAVEQRSSDPRARQRLLFPSKTRYM